MKSPNRFSQSVIYIMWFLADFPSCLPFSYEKGDINGPNYCMDYIFIDANELSTVYHIFVNFAYFLHRPSNLKSV